MTRTSAEKGLRRINAPRAHTRPGGGGKKFQPRRVVILQHVVRKSVLVRHGVVLHPAAKGSECKPRPKLELPRRVTGERPPGFAG